MFGTLDSVPQDMAKQPPRALSHAHYWMPALVANWNSDRSLLRVSQEFEVDLRLVGNGFPRTDENTVLDPTQVQPLGSDWAVVSLLLVWKILGHPLVAASPASCAGRLCMCPAR
jgi:hypothetical protein